MSKPVIAVDVDDVVAGLIPAWLKSYNRLWGDNLQPEDITDWAVHKFVKPECGEGVYKLLGPGLYDNDVEPLPGALEAVQRLAAVGRIVYVSAYTVGTLDAKLRWLTRHGFMDIPGASFVACKDKCLIKADYLIDDGVHNVLPRIKRGESALLIEQPHNKAEAAREAIPRWTLERAVDFLIYSLGPPPLGPASVTLGPP